jgi:hypothetical protein
MQFGQGMTDPSNPGIATVQVCAGSDFAGATLRLNVVKKYNYATSEVFAVSTPVTFLSGSSSTPTPTPTLSSTDQINALMGTVTKLQRELNAVNAKLNKVCKVKPKPKFC